MSNFKFFCNESLGPYAREYFKGTNVEIVVLKHYTEDKKENLVDICKGE